MKLFSTIFLMVLSFVSHIFAADSEVITTKSVGNMTIGRPFSTINNISIIYEQGTYDDEEGNKYKSIKIIDPITRATVVEIEPENENNSLYSNIRRIMVYSPKYKTIKNVTVGTTYAGFKKIYSVDKIYLDDLQTHLPPLFNVNGAVVFAKELKRVGFIFESSGEIKEGDKIKAIYLY